MSFGTCVKCGSECITALCDDCIQKANARVMKSYIEIPGNLWDKWWSLISCNTLTEDRAKGVVNLHGKLYVINGGGSDLVHKHADYLHAREVAPIESWDGPTLSYRNLVKENGDGGPFHSNYHKFRVRNQWYVILPDKVTYISKRLDYVQQKLF